MILNNLDHVPGYRVVKHLGLVCGNTIRARHAGQDFVAGLRSIVGGEINEYTDLLAAARSQAIERMVSAARKQGANAVINVRLSTSEVMPQAAELVAYGTAVVVEPVEVQDGA